MTHVINTRSIFQFESIWNMYFEGDWFFATFGWYKARSFQRLDGCLIASKSDTFGHFYVSREAVDTNRRFYPNNSFFLSATGEVWVFGLHRVEVARIPYHVL